MDEVGGGLVRCWVEGPLSRGVEAAIERIARSDDVRRVAVMPDVHLSADVCNGTVVATGRLLYPNAVGAVRSLPREREASLGAPSRRRADPADLRAGLGGQLPPLCERFKSTRAARRRTGGRLSIEAAGGCVPRAPLRGAGLESDSSPLRSHQGRKQDAPRPVTAVTHSGSSSSRGCDKWAAEGP